MLLSSEHASLTYLDFDLEITPGQGREYGVAARSPAGEARATMVFPFDDLVLENRLQNLQIALLRSGGKRRTILTQEERVVRDFGQALFDALLSGEARSRYEVCRAQAAAQGKGLRLRLRILPPELAALPWEFIHDSHQDQYVCLSANTPVVRYQEAPRPVQPLAVEPPLRILGLVADPENLPRLDVACEKERLERALGKLKQRGLVELYWLERATWRDLQRVMYSGPWHVFHFAGHGGFDVSADEGLIVLEDENKQASPLHAAQLALLLADHYPLRLAALNACGGAQGSRSDLFSSVAAALVRRGLPAALAMQYEITDQAAIELSQAFYTALTNGLPVDAAVSEARKAISIGISNSLEWGIPVLYMRAPDGVLFDVKGSRREGRGGDEDRLSVSGEQGPIAHVADEYVKEQTRVRTNQPPVDYVGKRIVERSQRQQAGAGVPKVAAGVVALAVMVLLVLSVMNWIADSKEAATQTAQALVAAVQTSTAASTSTEIPQPLFILTPVTPTRMPTNTPTLVTPASTPTDMPTLLPTGLPATITDEKGVKMALVPAGEFWMGSADSDASAHSDEKPQHRVHLDDFYIDLYEVTNALYTVCVQAGGCAPPQSSTSSRRSSYYGNSEYDNYPVIYVDWNQANAYCEWRGARLPTEAEWEKAARGGLEGKKYPWGDEPPVCQKGAENGAKFDDDAGCNATDTEPVGSYTANGYGLFDMAGNVWEWVQDWYSETFYASSPERNPTGPDNGAYRVVRGGSWLVAYRYVRSADRGGGDPDLRKLYNGLRCARSP